MSSFLSPLYQLKYIQLVHNIPVSGGHVIPSNELTGKVEFRNITFSYPSRPDQVILHIIIIHVHVMVTCSNIVQFLYNVITCTCNEIVYNCFYILV